MSIPSRPLFAGWQEQLAQKVQAHCLETTPRPGASRARTVYDRWSGRDPAGLRFHDFVRNARRAAGVELPLQLFARYCPRPPGAVKRP